MFIKMCKGEAPMKNPTPEQLKSYRLSLGLTQTEAGRVIYTPLRTYQDYEGGKSKMHPGLWELLQAKTDKGENG